MLRTASGQHSFHVISHLEQLHSSILLFFFLQEGEKDPPQTAEAPNTSCAAAPQTGRRKGKVPRFTPSLRSATTLLISPRPSVNPSAKSASSVAWSDPIKAIRCRKQRLSYLSGGETIALCQPALRFLKQMASAAWSCSCLCSSITFEAKIFPVCVPGEQSNDVFRSADTRSCPQISSLRFLSAWLQAEV